MMIINLKQKEIIKPKKLFISLNYNDFSGENDGIFIIKIILNTDHKYMNY